MNRLANVLVVSNDPQRASRLMETLTANRCEAVLCPDPPSFLAHARQDQPDLAIIDVAALGESGLETAAALRCGDGTIHVPFILVADDTVPAIHTRAFEIGADDLILEPFRSEELIHRMRPLFRLSTMHAEMNRRITLAREFAIHVPVPAAADAETPCRILVAGRGLYAPETATAAFGDRPCLLTTCEDTTEAENLLSARSFDVCILRVPTGVPYAPFSHLSFCNQVRDNPRLFNLPIVVAAPAAAYEQMDALFLKHGASRVLSEAAPLEAFRFALLSLVDRQRKRWSLRLAIEATRQGVARDPLSDTYTFEFLKTHLARLIDSAQTWRKNLSVVFLNFPSLPSLQKDFGDEAAEQLFQQLGQWTSALIRAEDMVARHGRHSFCVALPDTPLKEAQAVMHRVAGVLSYTDFAIRDVFHPVSVWVELGLAELDPDDTVEALLGRAQQYLEYTKADPT